MGVNPPDNLSSVGTMEVTDLESGATHTGVLLSDGLPQSGEFVVGQTYNAANLTGPQYVMDRESEQTHRLNGQFRLDNVTTMDGANQSSVAYRDVRYQSTNLTEYKQQQEDLRETLAEVEARQQKLRDPGVGGGFLGGSIDPGVGITIVAAAAVLVLLGRENRR